MQLDQGMTAAVTDAAESTRPYRYYALLIALYNAIFGGFLLIYRRKEDALDAVTPMDLAMLSMATLRVSKAISEDEITSGLRASLCKEEPDGLKPRGQGLRAALGKLVLCPTCTGTWVAACLGYALHLFPRWTRPFLAIMSASGLSQFSDAVLSLVYTDRDVLRREDSST